VKPITMTPETALDRAALIAAQDADAPKLTQRMDAEAMRVLVEHVNALRARVAELEAALADERKLADELAHSLMKEAAQTGEGCFFASTEVVIADHNARRAKEAAGE